ncbi:MAG: Arc family DNA-binding protein [Candidatus Zixiibacteriota bacterium]
MAEKKPFLLRVDREVLDSLQRWSEDELRSLNSHIEYLLREALKDAGRLKKKKE